MHVQPIVNTIQAALLDQGRFAVGIEPRNEAALFGRLRGNHSIERLAPGRVFDVHEHFGLSKNVDLAPHDFGLRHVDRRQRQSAGRSGR